MMTGLFYKTDYYGTRIIRKGIKINLDRIKVIRETVGNGFLAFACVLAGDTGEKIRMIIRANDEFVRIVNHEYIWIGDLAVRKDALTGVRRNRLGKIDRVYTDDSFLNELIPDADTEINLMDAVPEILEKENKNGQGN